MTYSVGLFLRYYNEYVFVGQMDKVSWIGAICSAFVFSMGAFSEVVINKLGFKKMLMVATLVCPLALMLASVSTQV
jgi:hypothetical protein